MSTLLEQFERFRFSPESESLSEMPLTNLLESNPEARERLVSVRA